MRENKIQQTPARLTLNMPTGSDSLMILSAFGFISIVNLQPAMLMSLGEEIGWRGFLVPELSKWVGFRKASLLSGAIWARGIYQEFFQVIMVLQVHPWLFKSYALPQWFFLQASSSPGCGQSLAASGLLG